MIFFLGLNVQAAGTRLSSQSSSSSFSGGGTGSGTSQTVTTATGVTQQTVQNSALAQRAQAALQKSTQALQAMQAAQNAAHAAALNLPSTVPNGLAIGGLVPDSGLASTGVANPVTTWVNAKTPIQTTSNGQTQVSITQTGQQALLNWNSFNIGKDTTLNFDQSAGGSNVSQWVAINKVASNVAPSQILGSMTAQGQVYVLNQNGIIFGGTSQINVHTLTASSLPINDNLSDPTTGRGLLNNPDFQYLFSQLDQAAGTKGPTPVFTAPATPTAGLVAKTDAKGNVSLISADGTDGDVVVQAGAQISSPTSDTHVGGRVALIGPNVTNAGTISTPDGQTILAAGLQVGLVAHPSNDPSQRGLDVSIGKVADSSYQGGAAVAGTAINSGLIEIPRADAMIAGSSVNQNGVIDSSTSVSLNGRVDLLADYNALALINGTSPGFTGVSNFYPTSSGVVTLGPDSLTQIVPELSSTDKVVGTQLALSSIVNLQGQSIELADNSFLYAPSANTPSDSTKPALGVSGASLSSGVSLNAGDWQLQGSDGSYALSYTSGQVYLDTGAGIDVSGSQNVDASVAENIISVQLLGSQLANSPLQRASPLRGKTVYVDIRQYGNYNGSEWVGTPLADTTGYVNLIERTVGELTTAGGTVAINAGGSVVMQKNSSVNVSGGWINYQGATVQTTKVISNGKILDISQATPNLVYDGIYTGYTSSSTKWGTTLNYSNLLVNNSQYQSGYIQAGNGGSLSISAPAMALDGDLSGNTVSGTYQRTLPSQVANTFANTTIGSTMVKILGLPTSSSLNLSFQGQDPNTPNNPSYSPTPPNIYIQSDTSLPTAGGFGSVLPIQRVTEVDLSPDLVNLDGFGNLTLNNSDGNITVANGVTLNAEGGGSITMQGANIDLEGSLSVPGGSLSFTVFDYSPYAAVPSGGAPSADFSRGQFTLGSSSVLSTAGLIVDDRPISAGAESLPLVINGGTITIKSFGADLESGSMIDASGGVAVDAQNKLTYGQGGNITIQTGQDPNLPYILNVPTLDHPQPALVLDSILQSYSGSTGGALSIKAPFIQVGGSTLLNGDTLGNTLWLNPTDASGNLLQTDFFGQGGFTSFSLSGIGSYTTEYLPGMIVAPGTTLFPKAQNWVASLSNTGVTLSPTLLPQSQRSPVSLAFGASTVKDPLGNILTRGEVILGAGAMVQTDPLGSVTMNAGTVTVLGSVYVPGGTISITGAPDSIALQLNTQVVPTIDLGPSSSLSTAGTVALTYNAYGFKTGSVLPGGKITIDGNIIAEAGAILDVSGASGVLDVLPSQAGMVAGPFSPARVPLRIDSNGGSITLTGEQELFTDATLLGAAGAPSQGQASMAQGGSLSIASGLFLLNSVQTPLDPNLVVSQNDLTIPDPAFYPAGQTPIGYVVVDKDGNAIAPRGYFATDRFTSGGFGSLSLAGTVQFTTAVNLNAAQSLVVASGGVILSSSTINLSAPYVALGTAFQTPLSAGQQLTNIFESGGSSYYFSPTAGTGILNVTANLIDVGNLSLQNIGTVNLTAINGDIRGNGTLDVSGTLNLTAGQIYPTTENNFTIAVYDYNGISGNGTITITSAGSRPLPLSGGGELDIYASNITQGGVLRAPMGTINLGSGVTGVTPVDLITGSGVSGAQPSSVITATQSLTLTSGSITSVSAVDPTTGQNILIPYGTNSNGTSWIDPAGNDITVAGNGSNAIPSKSVNLSAANITDQGGATIDIRGGGDLYAYQWVNGLGGTNDILNTNTSYAVIPGYASAYAPYYSANDYVNGTLKVGDQVYLNASSGLPAGVYTLLPARYALLPGAFLITPKSSTPGTTASVQPDGSSIVGGYRFNGTNPSQVGQPLLSSFEVEPESVVRSRAEYDNYYANSFLSQAAVSQSVTVPRLPLDSGQLVLAVTNTLVLQGLVQSQAQAGGLGGSVDIASPNDILIAGPNTDLSSVSATTLILNSSDLSSFGADNLLIGGYSQTGTNGSTVTVTTNNLTVDNAGATATVNGKVLNGLSGPDITLVSNQLLTLADDAEIEGTVGSSTESPTLLLNGDGTYLRVSGNTTAQTIRTGVDSTDTLPSMNIGAGVIISGSNGNPAGSLTLDSTYATFLDPTAKLNAKTVNLDSGQISLELTPQTTPPSTFGLVLSGEALSNLQTSAQALSLLSYSSIDIYGSGQIGGNAVSGQYPVASLALHASEIRGFSDSGGGGTVTINAQNISLDNSSNGTVPGSVNASSGSLTLNAATISLGTNQVKVDQYANLNLNASSSILLQSETKTIQSDSTVLTGKGSLIASDNLTMDTPLIAAATYLTTQAAANETIQAAGGTLQLNSAQAPTTAVDEGVGAKLTLLGQTVITDSTIALPSGSLTLEATSGNLSVGGKLSVAGEARTFNDLTKYTSGGQITLTSDQGSVILAGGSTVDVSAAAAGGSAGSLTVNATSGNFTFDGSTINGQGGLGGTSGSFSLDMAGIPHQLVDLTTLNTALNLDGFTHERSIRVRNDDVQVGDAATDTAIAQTFNLSVDKGSITVEGKIDASGKTGGTINLEAWGDVNLASGSELTVEGLNFDDAGKGGVITLAAGSETNGVAGPGYVNLNPNSNLILTVDANNSSAEGGNSAALGHLTGTLHLRAPQTSGKDDLQIGTIAGNIVGASSVVVEGYQLYTPAGGSIDSVEGSAETSTAGDGSVYGDALGFTSHAATILARLLNGTSNASQSALFEITPGAEIINPTGDLTLANNWDLSSFRFGPGVDANVVGSGTPGILTLRAAGNLVFKFGASLSDGFDPSNTTFAPSSNHLWTAPLLPEGDRSWSYQMVAGADFSGAETNDLLSVQDLQNSGLGGSVLIGKGAPPLPTKLSGALNQRAYVLATLGYYQTIRTGTGDITINAAGDVQLLNNLATIYTAGTQAPSLTGFTTPALNSAPLSPQYGAQYSLEGGNISIFAQGDIGHYNSSGQADSSKELPTNWLYRQGSVDANGDYVKSTSWWIDFSNFFEGVGALGGGNVTLVAGGSVNNVDAFAPTNARMPVTDANGNSISPSATNLVEFGGGDVTVLAGNNINGGVYYVERGQGTLKAGNQILTNSTRAAVKRTGNTSQPITWLPTTLFLGKGSFDVSSGGDLLLGPVVNPFWLPQGANNLYVNKSYFSTYATTDTITASSLTGSVTLKDSTDGGTGSLTAWYNNVVLAPNGNSIATASQAWLGLAETNFNPFTTVSSVMPANLLVTAFSGDVNVVGSLTLSPSPTGTIDLLAAGALNGFQINGTGTDANGSTVSIWGSSVINLSDADPASIPGIINPVSNAIASTNSTILNNVNELFAESGATQNLVLQTKQALHANINQQPLHANDPNPVHLYADGGNISGVTLFSSKDARLTASQDITDIALYIQNVNASQVSVVSAGRDIIAYDDTSTLRQIAATPGNAYVGQSESDLTGTGLGAPNVGDIQISGPGTLEVLAGRNLNLGLGPTLVDGTSLGITSVGNTRNPALPYAGADIIAGSGLGATSGLEVSNLNFGNVSYINGVIVPNDPATYGSSFVANFLSPSAGMESSTYLPELGDLMGLSGQSNAQIWTAFSQLPAKQQDTLALTIYYDVLRDAGQAHTAGGSYAPGYAAIAALFPGSGGVWPNQGDITLTSREIKTTNGGNISLIVPGGSLNVGVNANGGSVVDQGILTVSGGAISIFSSQNVNVGTSRIFTLHGGDEIIWSSYGSIAAGNSSKTVQSAPPTEVLVDPQSADVQTDLAGLATGGGLGVLATVAGAAVSNIDLIAPNGTISAGDAGIRASGNIHLAALVIDPGGGGISAGGKTTGAPAAAAGPNVAGLSAASNATAATTSVADQAARQAARQAASQDQDTPSIITVEVVGYGGGDGTQG